MRVTSYNRGVHYWSIDSGNTKWCIILRDSLGVFLIHVLHFFHILIKYINSKTGLMSGPKYVGSWCKWVYQLRARQDLFQDQKMFGPDISGFIFIKSKRGHLCQDQQLNVIVGWYIYIYIYIYSKSRIWSMEDSIDLVF